MQAQKQKLERFLKMTQASGCKATWLQGDPGTSTAPCGRSSDRGGVADLAEQIAPKGDPGTSTAPCGRSSDRGGVVQRDVSDHQRAAELL